MAYTCIEAAEETRCSKCGLKEEWVKMCVWMILVWKMEMNGAG